MLYMHKTLSIPIRGPGYIGMSGQQLTIHTHCALHSKLNSSSLSYRRTRRSGNLHRSAQGDEGGLLTTALPFQTSNPLTNVILYATVKNECRYHWVCDFTCSLFYMFHDKKPLLLPLNQI